MKNNQSNLIDTLRDRAEKESDILSGSISESIDEKKREIIEKTLKEVSKLEDIMKKFKFDNFYIYIYSLDTLFQLCNEGRTSYVCAG